MYRAILSVYIIYVFDSYREGVVVINVLNASTNRCY